MFSGWFRCYRNSYCLIFSLPSSCHWALPLRVGGSQRRLSQVHKYFFILIYNTLYWKHSAFSLTWNRDFGKYHLLDAGCAFFYTDFKSNYCTCRFHVCGQHFVSWIAMSTNWYLLHPAELPAPSHSIILTSTGMDWCVTWRLNILLFFCEEWKV